MNLSSQLFIQGLRFGLLTLLLMFVLSALTLLFSMMVASYLRGGIDFGPVTTVMMKGLGLLGAVTVINFLSCGIFLTGPVWFFGLMYLYGLDIRETRTLTGVNWSMNLVWKLLLIALML